MAMEFWGVEVKAGEPLKVEHLEGILVHLSQASLGEVKKDKANESVVLYVNVDGKKLVIGTLSPDKCPQIPYDLVFEKEFELSHSWKNGSVYFCGYKAEMEEESDNDGMLDSSSESDEEAPLIVPANGKPEPEADKSKVVADKAKAAKPESSKVKNAKPDDDSEDDDSDEEDDSEEDGSDDEDILGGIESSDDDADEDDDEGSSDEEEEATPKNAKQNKKRSAESATKTPVPEKKAKLVTPQKSGGDGKKGNTHTATPHPSKSGKGKADAKAEKSKQQSPKSDTKVACNSCNKKFNSDVGLEAHTKAKHSGGK